MNELTGHPKIAELMDALEKNELHKEKEKVQSLVDYIGDMEETLTEMLQTIQDMRREITLIRNQSLRAKCQNLIQRTDGKIRQALSFVGGVKEKLVQSAKNALATCKEKGRETLGDAVKAMKIPETLDTIGKLFCKFSEDMEQEVMRLDAMKDELFSAKRHLKNAGTLLVFRTREGTEMNSADKATASRFGKVLDKIGKGFAVLSQKAAYAADRIRVTHVKVSVRNELESLKSARRQQARSDPFRER